MNGQMAEETKLKRPDGNNTQTMGERKQSKMVMDELGR